MVQPVRTFPAKRHLVDSSLGHVLEWPLAAKQLKQPSTAEYFTVPRGRVLFDRREETRLIYQGNETNRAALMQFRPLFGLTAWKLRQDDHYLMGKAADEMFNE